VFFEVDTVQRSEGEGTISLELTTKRQYSTVLSTSDFENESNSEESETGEDEIIFSGRGG